MSDLLSADTDYEAAKYDEAATIMDAGFNAEAIKSKKSVFNPEQGVNEILMPMQSGGYVQIGQQSLEVEASLPGAVLIDGIEYGPETAEYQRYYPKKDPSPAAMTEAPAMPAAPEAQADVDIDMGAQVRGVQDYAAQLRDIQGGFSEEDLTAAGYSPQVIQEAGLGVSQVEPIAPLSQEEIQQQLQQGTLSVFTSDPTLRESGSQALTATLTDIALNSLREDLEAEYVSQTGEAIPARGSAEYPRSIQETLRTRENELMGEAEVLSNAVFGHKSGIGVADFATAGIMDIQEGARLFSQGRAENKDSKVDRLLGALLVAAGIAEATGVGMFVGKAIKKSLPSIRSAIEVVGERLNQPGPMPTTSSFGAGAIDDATAAAGLQRPVGSYVERRTDGAANETARNRVLEISQAKGNKKPKIEDLVDFFEEDHVNIHGRKLDPTSDQDFDIAVDAAADEIKYQMDQSVSGRGWYDEDVNKTFLTLSKVPGLEDLANNETLRIIWSAFAAPTSIGNKVDLNTRAATAAFLQYLKTGKVPVNPPAAGATTEGIKGAGWGMKQKSVGAGMKVISHLIDELGPEGFADWWLSPHTLKELTDVRKAAGLGGGPSGLSGGKDSVHLGAMVLGDKTGRYSLNINGYKGTTKDVWFSRSYNRHFGDMRNPDGSIAGGPRNQTERRRMEEFTARLLDRIGQEGLSEQDAQAILWFYEQNLFTDLGVVSRPGSFSEASEKILNDLRSGVRAGDEVKAGDEQAGERLVGFREVSPTKRAIRAERRPQVAGGRAEGDIRKEPIPYTRGSVEGDEGDGLLEFTPDPAATARYQAAGLSTPTIRQVKAADNAAEYNSDMTEAMAGHEFGAQVEIKSSDELANAQLFRTDNGSGFAIKSDGDIVAVFASKAEPEGGAYAMLQAAVAAGGRKLDAFDTYLPGIYKTIGFRPVARLPWNDEFAPPDWDKATFSKYNNGEPDVVMFVYDPDYFGEAVDVPVFTDYDEALAVQDAEVARLKSRVDEIFSNE